MSSKGEPPTSRSDPAAEDECSTSDAILDEGRPSTTQSGDREAIQKVQDVLRSKIQEFEAVEAEEKEIVKATKKAIRDVQKTLTSKDQTLAEKLEIFQQRFIERVNEQVKADRAAAQLQKKLAKVTAERVALSEEVRRLTTMNGKLQDLCRTLQTQNKSVVQDAQEKATTEAQQREELTERMEIAMRDISKRLEDHSAESQKCMQENLELRTKLEQVGQFCDDMEQNHKEQLARRETQIAFLRERMQEQAQVVAHYAKTETVLQEKCLAAEGARDAYAKQLQDAKERINGFCDSFEKSNAAFKQLQSQVDMSHKIQKKMQQESDMLKKRSDLLQQKSERLLTENETLTEQVDGMRGKLAHSVSALDHQKLHSQRAALEKLCRVLQAEIQELRSRLPNPVPPLADEGTSEPEPQKSQPEPN